LENDNAAVVEENNKDNQDQDYVMQSDNELQVSEASEGEHN
jgi:hypothetical protein